MMEIIENELRIQLWKKAGENQSFEELIESVMDRLVDPYTAAAEVVKEFIEKH